MARRSQFQPIGDALKQLEAQFRPQTLLAEVQHVWGDAVGPAIAAVAQPVSERDGRITVACGSAVWAQELDLMSPVLIEKLNQAIGKPAVRALRPQATPTPR